MADTKLPDKLQTAAIIQIASGTLNFFFMAGAIYSFATIGSVVCTLGMCPFGALCGMASFLLIPVGLVEVVSGVLIFTQNENALKMQRITSIVQKVSILFGGIGSIIASFVVDGMVNDPESLAFLEGHGSEF